MNAEAQFRAPLMKMAIRLRKTSAGLEEQARVATGGDSGGNISNSPMHLGDLGSGVYSQQLSSTLLENEEYLLDQVNEALDRINKGTYGKCENCGRTISNARLVALPYTCHCLACALELDDGVTVNMNVGRPQLSLRTPNSAQGNGQSKRHSPDHSSNGHSANDSHAAGTPGGGSAVGGLAGSTMGDGEPTSDMEAAMGSGQFDATLDTDMVNLSSYVGLSSDVLGDVPAYKTRRVRGQWPHSNNRPAAR